MFRYIYLCSRSRKDGNSLKAFPEEWSSRAENPGIQSVILDDNVYHYYDRKENQLIKNLFRKEVIIVSRCFIYAFRSCFSYATRLTIHLFRQKVLINCVRGVTTPIPKTSIMAHKYQCGMKFIAELEYI